MQDKRPSQKISKLRAQPEKKSFSIDTKLQDLFIGKKILNKCYGRDGSGELASLELKLHLVRIT